uniref:Uncharacterized protein n=1 Tax=Romanomermis culicivorax TaxID=13658 RepID=A0A915IUU9_ROMCU
MMMERAQCMRANSHYSHLELSIYHWSLYQWASSQKAQEEVVVVHLGVLQCPNHQQGIIAQ